jgi:hypothetical protein
MDSNGLLNRNEHSAARSWTVSVQLRVWFSATVDADSEDQAVAAVEDAARTEYGDDIFVYPGGVEIA